MKEGIVFRALNSLIFLGFLVCYFVLGAPDATPSPPSNANKGQIEIIETELSREKEKYEAFDSQEKDLLAQLSYLEQEVAEKRKALEALSKKIVTTKSSIKELEGKLANVEQLLKNAEDKVARRLVALYKYARKGYMKILVDVRDPDQFWQRVKYVKAIVEEDRKVMDRLGEEKEARKKEISHIKRQLVEKEAISNKAQMQLSSLRKDLEEKVIQLMKTHKEKEFYETAVKELELAAKDLKQTLLDIEKKDTYKTIHHSRFENAKGQLPLPLKGKIIRGDNLSGPTKVGLHRGIFIEGAPYGKVKAVFPGRVDFSGQLKGYGEIIIINHGSRFFTISAHLSRRMKEKGDVVEAEDVIGTVGQNGALKVSRIYFEIRRAGSKLDTLKWLKVR